MPKRNFKFKILNYKFASAYTLIEILVVISIIGALAGAILYSTENARVRGRDQKRKDDLKTINSALVSYRTDNKSYPPLTGPQRDFASDYNPQGWIPEMSKYIKQLPKDPVQGSDNSLVQNCDGKSEVYCLRVNPNRTAFVLWARLENIGDRDIATSPTAHCRVTDPDFSTGPGNTSPFKGLGKPFNSALNYCIKSTQ